MERDSSASAKSLDFLYKEKNSLLSFFYENKTNSPERLLNTNFLFADYIFLQYLYKTAKDISALKFNSTESGKIISIYDGIAKIIGLTDVKFGEAVIIPSPSYNNLAISGLVINIEFGLVSAVVFDFDRLISRGDLVIRTKALLAVNAGSSLLGRVINAVCVKQDVWRKWPLLSSKPQNNLKLTINKRAQLVENNAPSFIERQSVTIPLVTGWKVIDSLIPIGRGQRELIVGDRRTGKTVITLDVILSQKYANPPVFCIYVAIGQRKKDIISIVNLFRFKNCLRYVVIISAPADDPAVLQYLAPYVGCSIGEWFRNRGHHSLVIYDDLSKHANSYRQVSLLLRRPPGREAYPGDVFYLHSRLLERAAMLSDMFGGGSLTALPVAETIDGDISAYIVTNLISITDGQLFLDKYLLESGTRPAIHTTLSVSRIGASAQVAFFKKIIANMKILLSDYKKLSNFGRFGASLDETTMRSIKRGRVIFELLNQNKHQPFMLWQQCLLLYSGVKGFLDFVDADFISVFELEIIALFRWVNLIFNIVFFYKAFFIYYILNIKVFKDLNKFIDNSIESKIRLQQIIINIDILNFFFEFGGFDVKNSWENKKIMNFLKKGGKIKWILSIIVI